MAVNWEVLADQQVTALRSALWSGEQDLSTIPKLIRSLIKDDLWRRRLVEQKQEIVEFQRFPDFVQAPAPDGLGTTVETLKKFCQSAGDMEAVDLIDQAEQRKRGERNVNNINVSPRPEGTSSARALRDLRKKRPDLHSRVIAKEISPHAAMVDAGLRIKTHTIPHEPARVAAAIRRHFTPAEVAEIARLLHWDRPC
jgi:hypothetical protein